MDKALADLIKISTATGKDPKLVQGGGGNTSVKTEDGKYMYVKASGTALKNMGETTGWRRINLEAIGSIITDKSLPTYDVNTREVEVVNRLVLCCEDDVTSGARPSVEAPLHALLDDSVIHLHPTAVGAYVNAKDGKAKLENLFKDEKLPMLWVPYLDPGYTLAVKIAKLIENYVAQHGAKPKVIFLEKHGLFVAAKTPNAAIKLVTKVIDACSAKLKAPKAKKAKTLNSNYTTEVKLAIRKAFFQATGQRRPVMFFNDEEIMSYASSDSTKKLLAAPAITPDELVYANGTALWLESVKADKIAKKISATVAKGGKPQVAFMVKGLGLFVVTAQKTAPIVRDIVAGSLFIRFNADKMGGIFALSKKQQDFINNWEAEAFRAKQVGGSVSGQLEGKIAIITGAGSGIGRSLAIGLARAGAQVAIADIDTNAAGETAQLIESEIGSETIVIKCNVTSEESVYAGFDQLIDAWGGLDILVNAAGVAPAFSLVDLPVDKWRFALEVNLTGYYLMAQAASKIMIQQDMEGSIVNISSKSGLDASKNNTPYNATKAGELHMSRGWAMELGTNGIRVNSVCPGNVFEGSKIWNPEYIKICAKKYSIKPEEVIPYYVSKTILGIEIKGQDIADSVVFLSSDQARVITGQTIVVDAGQVMVR